MGWEKYSTDQLEQQLIEDERLVSRLRLRQMAILEVMDARQVASADGCRSLSEWAASRFDMTLETARRLVRTMRRTVDRPDLREALDGGVSFDRIEAVSRIQADVGLLEHLDVAGVHREAAARLRVTAEDEHRTAEGRFLVMQPSLDESWWKGWFGLDGVSGAIMDKVLTETADTLPTLPDGSRGESSWRKATALVQTMICDEPLPAQVTVIVDANHAAATTGEAGVTLEAGPRVGRQALQAILCDAEVEVTVRAEDGRYMEYGRRQRTAPPALRRALLHRYGFRCAADGCDSRYRLEVHHLTPWSEGGETNQDELILLCWYHHHVVVHQRGLEIYRHADHGRMRFREPDPPQDKPPQRSP